ncbi:hypothetical protein [Brevundimonas sp.]|jgi:ATP-dependent RNA circularization protein (DNA/RNA ligase family)
MKTTTLIRVSFGSAKALTRDGLTGPYTEVKIQDSLFPPAG